MHENHLVKTRVLRSYLLIMLIFCGISSNGQSKSPGNWLMYFGMNRISKKVSIHTEAQYRIDKINSFDLEQLLLRTGVNYHLNDQAMFTAGYGFIKTSSYGSFFNEHRIWQQVILKQKLARVHIEHRYRTEQRWIEPAKYANRFRYRIMTAIPLNKKSLQKGSISLNLYDEVFINDERTYFDQNRFYIAGGYHIRDEAFIQLGVLHQQLNDVGQWNLQVGLFYNPRFNQRQ